MSDDKSSTECGNGILVISYKSTPQYVKKAKAILNKEEHVVIIARGTHTYKAVSVAELLKREDPTLHQETQIGASTTSEKNESQITIKLSKAPVKITSE